MARTTSSAAASPPVSLRNLQFWLATMAVHLYFVSYGISVVNVPSSLVGEPDWVVGVVVGALGISGMLTRPLVGIWVDSGSRERWGAIGGIGTVIAFVGYGLSLDPWIMLIFRLIHGVAMGLFTTSLMAIVAGLIPERQRGMGLGLYQSGNAVGQLYAAPLAVWVATQTSFEVSFLVGAGSAFSAVLVGILVHDRHPPEPKGYVPWRKREWVSNDALIPAIVFLTMTTTVGAVGAFLPLFAASRDLGNPGLYYSVWGLTVLFMRFIAGAAGDRLGTARILIPSLIVGAISLFLLASAQDRSVMLAAGALSGIGLGGVQVSIASLVIERAHPASRGAAMATYTMAWDVGAVAGGMLLGFVVDATSYSFGFVLVGFLPLFGLGLFAARMAGRGPRTELQIVRAAK